MSNPSVPDAVRAVFYQTVDEVFGADKIAARPDRLALTAKWEGLREVLFRSLMALLCVMPALGATIWIADLKLIDVGNSAMFKAVITAEFLAVVVIAGWHALMLYKCLYFFARISMPAHK